MNYEGTIQDFIEWAMNSEGSTFALFGKTIRTAEYKFTTALFDRKIEYTGKIKSNRVIIKCGDTDIVFHIFSHYQHPDAIRGITLDGAFVFSGYDGLHDFVLHDIVPRCSATTNPRVYLESAT